MANLTITIDKFALLTTTHYCSLKQLFLNTISAAFALTEFQSMLASIDQAHTLHANLEHWLQEIYTHIRHIRIPITAIHYIHARRAHGSQRNPIIIIDNNTNNKSPTQDTLQVHCINTPPPHRHCHQIPYEPTSPRCSPRLSHKQEA